MICAQFVTQGWSRNDDGIRRKPGSSTKQRLRAASPPDDLACRRCAPIIQRPGLHRKSIVPRDMLWQLMTIRMSFQLESPRFSCMVGASHMVFFF